MVGPSDAASGVMLTPITLRRPLKGHVPTATQSTAAEEKVGDEEVSDASARPALGRPSLGGEHE
jgi:hypothetical protein